MIEQTRNNSRQYDLGVTSVLKPLVHALAVGLFSAWIIPAVPAQAATITFAVPVGNLDGQSFNGFTFHGDWRNAGNDTVNAPFMDEYLTDHSLSYDLGRFTFHAATFSGLPWDGFSGAGGLLHVQFLDDVGNLITESTILLPNDNAFHALTETVYGVHRLYFPATNGFFPRLQTIEFSEAPEPATLIMLGSGLGALALLRRPRRRGRADAPSA
jgi:hypothetical protein